MENFKEEFVKIYRENISRDGADKLLDYLEKSDFFTAPASTRFHSCHEGGLCEHSVKVYRRFLRRVKEEFGENFEEKVSKESVALIALLHDVCKVDCYKTEMRNVKENDKWVQKPYYTVEDRLPYGHGEKSVYIINGFLRLTREEAIAINWHMGGFDARVMGGSYALKDAFYAYPLALLFHLADVEATYLDESQS